ncbi:DUF4181 domain-containing protein [Planococcus shixiaomingii]|uniref:DUF4181 domain-containing protein n=1 Tax=Planococcus shixiaomingii TaxID=3058393 RepID=UPI00260BA40D|nr:DUF4181 domain-containing protein [Planococcus sp. N022]WKA54471.1 DUF4181 domain-containing protein [Planococcus sp. N022]
MEFVLLLIILLGLLFGLEMLLRKWLGVKKTSLSDTPAKNIDRWGRGIVLVIALCVFYFGMESDLVVLFFWFWVVFLTWQTFFQAFLQWKYIRESKEHLVTLLLYPVGIAALFAIAYIYS